MVQGSTLEVRISRSSLSVHSLHYSTLNMILSHHNSVLGSCFAALHCNSRNCSQAATGFCLRPEIDRIMAAQNHAERYSRSAAPSMVLSHYDSVLGSCFGALHRSEERRVGKECR